MTEFTPDERADRVCLKCGQQMSTMKIVMLHDGGKGVLHDCGTVYTREFMRDHFGVEWTDGDALQWPEASA